MNTITTIYAEDYNTLWNVHIGISEHFQNTTEQDRSFCLCLITKGSVIMDLNNKFISLIAPACICINEREQIKLIRETDSKIIRVNFNPAIINSHFSFKNVHDKSLLTRIRTIQQDYFCLQAFIERDNEYMGFFQLQNKAFHKIMDALNDLKYNFKTLEIPVSQYRGRVALLELLFTISKIYRDNLSLPVMSTSDDTVVTRVINYINHQFKEKITIKDLSIRFNTNRTTLCESFRQSTGLSIVAYINKIRIQQACILLRDTTLPISELLFRVGFNDTCHFTRTFKKYTNMTPGKYRKEFSWLTV